MHSLDGALSEDQEENEMEDQEHTPDKQAAQANAEKQGIGKKQTRKKQQVP
jgi:hypothetical protein